MYEAVTEAFVTHCVSKRNVIFKAARFNIRIQEPVESVEFLITVVHTLAEHCEFGGWRAASKGPNCGQHQKC